MCHFQVWNKKHASVRSANQWKKGDNLLRQPNLICNRHENLVGLYKIRTIPLSIQNLGLAELRVSERKIYHRVVQVTIKSMQDIHLDTPVIDILTFGYNTVPVG